MALANVRSLVLPWTLLLALGACARPSAAPGESGRPDAAPSATGSVSVRSPEPAADAAAPPAPEPPAGLTSPGRDRWLAARDAKRATVARADQPINWDADEPVDTHPDRFAGLKLRKGTTRELSPSELARFAELLRDPKGFNDDIRRRCVKGRFLAFRLSPLDHQLVGMSAPITDVMIDFDCGSIWVVSEESGDHSRRRTVTDGYIDPSFAAFRDFARALFPGDRDLATVRSP